MVSVIASLE